MATTRKLDLVDGTLEMIVAAIRNLVVVSETLADRVAVILAMHFQSLVPVAIVRIRKHFKA
jgi:hypothetical protein